MRGEFAHFAFSCSVPIRSRKPPQAMRDCTRYSLLELLLFARAFSRCLRRFPDGATGQSYRSSGTFIHPEFERFSNNRAPSDVHACLRRTRKPRPPPERNLPNHPLTDASPAVDDHSGAKPTAGGESRQEQLK